MPVEMQNPLRAGAELIHAVMDDVLAMANTQHPVEKGSFLRESLQGASSLSCGNIRILTGHA